MKARAMPYTAPTSPATKAPAPVALRLSTSVLNVWRDRRKTSLFDRLETLPAGAFVAFWPAWIRETATGREVEAMPRAVLVLASGDCCDIPHGCRADILKACDLGEAMSVSETLALCGFRSYNSDDILQTMMAEGALTPSTLAAWVRKTEERWAKEEGGSS